ncbi:BMP family ABC transporter substrate-binding protein [Anaerolineales bacterium HSG25]|nr:BMP family ABC transporter substrate-binding protein [Anaerolineales bacterium HSG25]
MNKRFVWLITILATLALVAAQCGGAETPAEKKEPAPAEEPKEEAPAEEEEPAPAEEEASGPKFGQVTDAGGVDDKGFNQLAWAGLQQAGDELGVEVKVLESKQQTDYEKNINEFINEGFDGIITVGFLLADATKAAADANPDSMFGIVDFPSQASNDMGMLFAVDQPSFQAGYLAAGMSETGIVCTYGGIKIPPVTGFMVGFEQGVKYHNAQKGTDVQVLGWETDANAEGGGEGSFTGNFESLDDGRSYAENFFDEGCDIILPVAGPVGVGSAAAAQDRGTKLIGVDADWYETASEYSDVYLTSVLKNIDVAVAETVKRMHDGSFEGGTNYVGILENGGVGLASFHDYEDAVSPEMRDELEAIKQGIIDGSIDTTGSATTEMPEDTASEAAGKGGIYGQVTDVGGIDDKGFNQLAWTGMQAARDTLGVEVKVLESKQQTDYEKNLNEFFNEGYDGIITVGFLLADATKAASETNPDTPIAIVDFPSQTSGDMGLLFAVDQPSFMAGYLAASMSETGVVCTYGGIKIPPVTSFMVGFEGGVKYYNEQKGTEVALLGWETDAGAEGGGEGAFTGNFESLDDGRSYAENFFDEGCDIILPVAGPVGLGSASAAQDRGLKVIGVDADLTQTAPEFQDVYLTSVLKKIDIAVFEAIKLMDTGEFEGGSNYISTLENDGVGLAPYYDFEDAVSQEMRDELSVIKAGIIAGDISTGWPVE